jgi:hypothetical protein
MINCSLLLNLRENGCRQKISERTSAGAAGDLEQVAMTLPQARNAIARLQTELLYSGQSRVGFSEIRFEAVRKFVPYLLELWLLAVEAVVRAGGRSALQPLMSVAHMARCGNRYHKPHFAKSGRCNIVADDGLAHSLVRAAVIIGTHQAVEARAYAVMALMGALLTKH